MKSQMLVLLIFILSNRISFGQTVVFRQPSDHVKQFVCNDTSALNSINYKFFRIYFKTQSYTAKNLDKVKMELDIAYSKILSILNINTYEYGIYLVAVDSKEEIQG